MIVSGVLIVCFALVWLFLTSSSVTSMRMAGAYPFAVIIFGLVFLYLFVAADTDYLKWVNGIMFLLCGFACMQDVEKIRRKHKNDKETAKKQPGKQD